MDSLLFDWSFWGRPEQFPPGDDWNIWLVLAGRGFGKTRTAAEWVREEAKSLMPDGTNKYFALVGRTAADGRDVIVEGESGIMSISPPSERPKYEPSKRRLTWENGNRATIFTADEPNNLRGPQFTHAWGDEVAAWRRLPDDSGLTAWDNLRIATRLGTSPKILITTTPKRVPLMFSLLKESEKPGSKIRITKGSTMDNAGNLADEYITGIQAIYGGSRIERQELYGDMLDEVEGALWVDEQIEDNRVSLMPEYAPLRVVGVDPSVAENPRDECGIVVCASTAEYELYKRRAWVLEDASIHGSPEVWARKVVETARKWGAPVVAEVNQGGALVTNAIHQIDPTIQVLEVHSKQGKQLRAEPITLAYDQNRVHHFGAWVDLETQMTSWIPEETSKSPDRVDALVHALTALLIKPPPGFGGGRISAKSMAHRSLPSTRGSGSTAGRVGPASIITPRSTPRRGGPSGGFRVR